MAHAGSLDRARARLDADNRAAQQHQAAAAAALRATAAARAQQAALVTREVAAAAALRVDETATAALVGTLDHLTRQAHAARSALQADSAAIAPLLPLMARLALHPAATLLAADAAPGRAAEGALVMQGLTREIGARATALRAARRRYAALTADLSAQQAALTQAITTQQASDAALQRDIAKVSAEQAASIARHAAEQRAANIAAAHAHDLVGVIARLESDRRRAAKARAQAAAARLPAPGGVLPQPLRGAPVAGRLIRAFGAPTAAGPATGDTFAASPGGVVSAACTGQVVFAKPFESYGKLIILDCGGGYDFVMAGLERFSVSVGQSVRAGQPVGSMARYDLHDPGNQPSLYVELRRHGTAIDPAGHFGAGT
ncbi:peptidoglycan DD-metalloendopeptidase family protein [Acidiphilium sp. PA]|uniref:murein hydrolase activator EnvC family protein n=1 Tax=Acidiphilium sp. PA TaxID=2871705 RepID=UPI002243A82C|nr:peptidoglycan DD-metalloendopeptidase family protein [Acidiphilium sp. PA]MCW8306562.1 peptidoglycan DD-metalloendopeptidase family protein [Acidiphilium sp. PA]